MKISKIAPWTIILLTLYLSCGILNNEQVVNPVDRVSLADPFILLYKDVNYAYGTHSKDGIAVFTSDNLKVWQKGEKLALHKDDSFGEKWFWAPEVYLVDGKFFMYYSADEHMCVAVSDSPLGPFMQTVQKPMVEVEKTIDNSLFIDDDGTLYNQNEVNVIIELTK